MHLFLKSRNGEILLLKEWKLYWNLLKQVRENQPLSDRLLSKILQQVTYEEDV